MKDYEEKFYLLASLGDGLREFTMLGQRFHCVGDDVLALLVVIDTVADDEAVQILIDTAD